VYDTTLAPGASFRVVQPEFDLGFWQPVLEGMHIGGKRKAMIPASLAYDKDGSVEYRIGPNEDLVIEFEILSFEMPLFLPPDAELDAETQELMESGDFFNLGGDDENDDDGGEDDDDGG
jgi:hypothetical protein